MNQLRPTWAEISRDALLHNVGLVRAQLPADVGVVAMIKADAYGHGATQVGLWLESAGVAAMGVATIEEGIELRAAGVQSPILVMGGLMGGGVAAARAMLAQRLTPVLHAADGLRAVAEAAAAAGGPIDFHLKIDTGMTRLGVRPEQVPALLTQLADYPQLRLAGVMTHFAEANHAAERHAQCECFAAAAATIRARVAGPLVWHLGNSAAVIHHGDSVPSACTPFALQSGDQFWVRPGIMLYGIAPFPEDEGRLPLRPVMSLHSRIILAKSVPTGTKVSYGGMWTAPRPSRLGTIPVGYADGYPWGAVGQARVLVRGVAVPIVGRITMDMVICDLTDCPESQVGDEVVFLGQQGSATLRAEEIARWCGTIPYEIVCRVSKRVPRIYHGRP
ncbi:MAG: alanine racemase [Deltaproteobacteria bacterium]|nr:alanine racemase [Deltaproteobacteria bacterium]